MIDLLKTAVHLRPKALGGVGTLSWLRKMGVRGSKNCPQVTQSSYFKLVVDQGLPFPVGPY